jgi:hypothetical protein
MFLGLKHFDGQMDGHITRQVAYLTIPICAPFLRVAQTQLMRNSLKARLFVRASVWICITVKRGYLQKTAPLSSE